MPRPISGLLVFLLVLSTAGCGGDDSEGPTEPPEPAPPEEPAEPSEETTDVDVYFPLGELEESCTDVSPVEREVDADDPLTGAVEALLAGPTPDELAEGHGGWFTDETAGMLRSAEVRDGIVHVDLDDLRGVIPNASTSCGSALLLAQLDRTVLGVTGAELAIYSIDGSEEAFYEWLQYDVPSAEAPEAAEPLTVELIVAHIESGLEIEALSERDVTLTCDADGEVAPGDVFVCSVASEPAEPADWGQAIIAVLGDDLYALSLATDNPGSTAQLTELYAAAPTGLTCAGLRGDEVPFPFNVVTTDEVGGIFWSIVYWNLEGRPDRMDEDLDGVPCETLYPDGAVATVLRTIDDR